MSPLLPCASVAAGGGPLSHLLRLALGLPRECVDFSMCGIFADAHDVGLFEFPGVRELGLWRGDRGRAYVPLDDPRGEESVPCAL